MKSILTLNIIVAIFMVLISCSVQPQPTATPFSTDVPPADMPNPASAFCVEQGYRSEIRTAADGSQSGYCIFPDGSECDEWAYFRGECALSIPAMSPAALTNIPTVIPFAAADYQGWWTYTHPMYGFSIMLPDGWVVNEITSNDPLMNGHTLILGGQVPTGFTENIRVTFRRVGEETPLWPTGAGPGEFVEQGTLDIAGEPARRVLLVCPIQTNPDRDVTSIWYHGTADGQPNIVRGKLEFGFIFRTESHCQPGDSLTGKIQKTGEMIIASLKVP